MKDLKGLANTINNYTDEELTYNIEDTVSHVINGNYGFSHYNYIMDLIDTTKKNYGKRGNNLLAWVGNTTLQLHYNLTPQQANKIWHYLDATMQDYFTEVIKRELEYFEQSNAE